MKFKESLTKVVAKSGKKFVIIVDELDRCKPTYAVQTLEFVKHLFDIEGVIFVFALDIPQLSSAVKSVYGVEVDTAGYLCRFFDYIGKLPNPDIRAFVSMRLKAQQFYKRILNMNFYNQKFEEEVTDFIVALSGVFSLSLRDLDSILSAYQFMTRAFLRTYFESHAHMIYIFLLTLKNNDICLYGRLFSERTSSTQILHTIEEKYSISQLQSIKTWFQAISNETIIEETSYLMYREDDIVDDRSIKIKGLYEDSNGNTHVGYYFAEEGQNSTKKHIFNKRDNFGRVLFYEDLLKWDQIHYLFLYEYYYQQLEMFNFALSADEPETSA